LGEILQPDVGQSYRVADWKWGRQESKASGRSGDRHRQGSTLAGEYLHDWRSGNGQVSESGFSGLPLVGPESRHSNNRWLGATAGHKADISMVARPVNAVALVINSILKGESPCEEC
jgi:hypothetical protein